MSFRGNAGGRFITLAKTGVIEMHYKNGREAKNGDKVVLIPQYGGTPKIGILYDATAGNNTCNGRLAEMRQTDPCPNLAECLHIDDVITDEMKKPKA